MSTDDIQVRISAQIDELIAGMNSGTEAITSRLDAMRDQAMAAGDALGNGIGQGAQTATQELARADEELQGIGGTLESVNTKFHELMEFLGLRFLYEAAKKLVEELDEVSEYFIKMSVTAQSLNVTVEQMQGLGAISRDAAVPISNLSTLMGELQGRMARAAEEGGSEAQMFENLGISLQEMRDPSFTVIDAMEQMGAAGNSNKEILAALGERGQNLLPVLREIAADHGLIAEKFKEVNGLTQEEINTLYAYHEAMSDVSERVENMTARIEGGLVPAIQELIRDFGELTTATPEEDTLLQGLKATLDEIVLTITSLAYAFKGAIDVILAGLKTLVDPFAAMAAALNDLLHGRFEEASNALRAGLTDVADNVKNIGDTFDKAAAQGDAAVSRLRYALAGLSEVTVTAQKEVPEHDLPNLSTDLSSMQGIGKDLEEEIREMLAQDKQTLSELLADAVSNAKQQYDIKEGELKKEQNLVDEAYAHHQISAKQDYQQTVSILNQQWEATQAYYKQLQELYASDAKALAAIHSQEEAEHQKYLSELEKAQDTYNQHVLAQWKWAADGMKDALATALKDMLTTYNSFAKDIENMMVSILDTLINKLASWIAQWIENWILAKITTQTTAASQISANAGVAASAAMGSVAAIPFVGWAMAPGVGASTMAEALSYEGLAAAAGGWEVPADQLAYVHKDEKILPPSISRGLNDLIASGGPNKGGQTLNAQMNINAHDSKSFERHLSDPRNRDAIVKVLSKAFSKGRR